jgi:3-phenylpropionate/trans-cinnamate dioxygenase ferredoxin reductase subunit
VTPTVPLYGPAFRRTVKHFQATWELIHHKKTVGSEIYHVAGAAQKIMARNIVVIGGGPAAVFAAIEAKKRDGAANVTLVSNESCEPYEKPPLSKAVLLGKAKPEDAPIAGPGGITAHGITLKLVTHCTAIDRTKHEVETTDGRLPYDSLVIATGSLMRELPTLPVGMLHVHYLRTAGHAHALKSDLANCRHLVVIGAGLIGLEVAASAAELGIAVTVIETAPRIMARACDEETGDLILAEHRRRGVAFKFSTSVIGATQQHDDRIALDISHGDVLFADVVVVGVGVKPNDILATSADLEVQEGIVVDAQCRTSDPAIFAAGDATRFPGPHGLARLENWRHAQDQGAVAGRNAGGGSEVYNAVPSYWTEQYDLYIQAIGWPDAAAQTVRRPLQEKSALVLETKNGVVTHALGINAQRDLAAVRRLIERNIPVDQAVLADPGQPFAAMLRARA